MEFFKTTNKSLSFKITSKTLSAIIIIGAGLYIFTLRPVTTLMEERIELDLHDFANRIYSICDQNDMKIMRLGNLQDDPTVKIIKGYTIGFIEELMNRNDTHVIIQHKNSFLLKPPNTSIDLLQQLSNAKQLQNFPVHENVNEKHYTHSFRFEPWDWKIYIFKNEESYALLTRNIKMFYNTTGLLLILAVVFLLYYLNRSINQPVKQIISQIRAGNKPQYRGIGEFEYLSENFSNAFLQIEQKNQQLKGLNIELDNEVREHKIAEKKLQSSEKKYRELVQNANNIILRMDTDGHITFFNEYAQHFFGFSEEEIIGQHVIGTIVPETESTGRNLKSLLDDICKEPKKHEYNINENICKNGERVWVAWTNKLLVDKEDEPVGTLSIGSDITERKELEKRLEEAKRMESLGTLAGGIAHDFNNNLTTIIGYAELVLDDINEPEVKGYINEIINAGLRSKTLTSQILAFSRHNPKAKTKTAISTIATESVKLMRASLPPSITLIDNTNPCDAIIEADSSQINQAIMNLFNNSVQEMSTTGGVITVTLDCIELTNNNKTDCKVDLTPGPYAKLSVSDTGNGIPTQYLDRIYEPFFTTKEVGKGSGMGLAVVHGIIQNHEGAIAVDNNPGKGVTFHILLPISSTS